MAYGFNNDKSKTEIYNKSEVDALVTSSENVTMDVPLDWTQPSSTPTRVVDQVYTIPADGYLYRQYVATTGSLSVKLYNTNIEILAGVGTIPSPRFVFLKKGTKVKIDIAVPAASEVKNYLAFCKLN